MSYRISLTQEKFCSTRAEYLDQAIKRYQKKVDYYKTLLDEELEKK